MAVIKFGQLSPLYNTDRSHVVLFGPLKTFFFGPLNITWWSEEGIWVVEGFKQHTHYLLKKHSPELVLAVRKTDQNVLSVPTHLYNDCRCLFTS